MGFKKIAKKLAEKVRVVYFAMRHPRTPWYAKLLGALVLLYALSPIDLIPDFIPVIGLLDDLVVVPAGLYLVLKMIPEDVVKDIEKRATSHVVKTKSNILGALLIVSIWIFVSIMMLNLFLG